jgi:hypothetical protein
MIGGTVILNEHEGGHHIFIFSFIFLQIIILQ